MSIADEMVSMAAESWKARIRLCIAAATDETGRVSAEDLVKYLEMAMENKDA